MSKMMRITEATLENLEVLVKILGKSKQAIIERAVDHYLREQFLKKANEEYAQIRANPELWAQEIKEREEWDVTIGDGLEESYE